ncbi:Pyrimidine-specific ribonucleoside hydrolase RihB [Poriferisphaera corsica]|uniref:Pyrimidine-specific ribonucleoside hydrolase RihB n=1 Tax=Poriferisphaera corsica TaxID=2528020 RepID=A0A517YV50_9BACT|nr:nucleoside hydrolase [Poriferisphaera corsica]QDU34095.1 Pyrimidine-specific ribonucleoside hydrolase RihB [Poriferisphaera corsica]
MRWLLYVVVVLVSYGLMSCGGVSDREVEGGGEKIQVWMDVDPANGIGEVDDGLMMIAGFSSERVDVRGVSVVFGNSPVVYGKAIGGNIVRAFGPEYLWSEGVHVGAESDRDLGEETEAVKAMIAGLEGLEADESMVVLATGPVTNVATVLLKRPDLQEKIQKIVVVAGRRPGQKLRSGEMDEIRFTDLNFENDVEGMQVLLRSEVELVLVPWEVASQVWLTRDDLEKLRAEGGGRGIYIYATTQHWFDAWEKEFGAGKEKGFNPFDTLALGYVVDPGMFETEEVVARVERGLSDMKGEEMKMKDYLTVRKVGEVVAGVDEDAACKEVCYVYGVDAKKFKEWLLEHLRD